MSRTFDVIIVGAGIQGCAAALFLARKAERVLVIEKDHIARHASGVNSGGVRTLGRHLSELPLAIEARRYWQHMRDLVRDDCGFRAVGNVRVAENPADMEKLLARSRSVAALNIDHREEPVDADELRRLVPAIARHCIGGVHVSSDGYADPYRTTRAFARAARAAGAEILEGVEVVGARRVGSNWQVETNAGVFAAPLIANCAGAWGDKIARLLGEHIPLVPNGSMQFITERLPTFVEPVVGSASRAFSLKQFGNGTVLFGGGHRAPVFRDTNRCDLDSSAMVKAANAAATLFPMLRHAHIVRVWSGIEGFTRDGLPVMGPGREQGVFHAFGFSGHGFQLGPGVGAVIAEALTTGSSTLPIDAFSPVRLRDSMGERHAA
jgi:sarcosine oxidase subunit beta